MSRIFSGVLFGLLLIGPLGVVCQGCAGPGGQSPVSTDSSPGGAEPNPPPTGENKVEHGAATRAEAVAQPFEADGLWGYRDADGRVIIQPRFLMAEPFSAAGLAAVADERGWAYLDRRGKVLLRPFIFDNGPDPFEEGLARYVDGGKIGYFDEGGNIVIPARFDFGLPFQDGGARVCSGCRRVSDGEHTQIQGGRWWTINREGIEIDLP